MGKGQQRRISDLRGVVVLEDIEKWARDLQSDDCSIEEKKDILTRLAKKQPSTEIIGKTGIGRVIKRLMKLESQPEVAKLARQVKIRWENLISRRVELALSAEKSEVVTDLETRCKRDKALDLLRHKFESTSVSEETLVTLERGLFHHFRPIIGNQYCRAVRKIVIKSNHFKHCLEVGDIDSVLAKAVSKS